MATTMKVIKNGIEEERMIAYYEKGIDGFSLKTQIPVPVMNENEYCLSTIDGKYIIIDTEYSEDN